MRKDIIRNVSLFTVLILLTHCVQENQKADDAIRLIMLNSMQRALPGAPLTGKSVIEIMSAKNEYEAFQVIITPSTGKKLEIVKIEISELEGDNGRIGKENLTLFRAEDVHLRNPSPRSAFGPGL